MKRSLITKLTAKKAFVKSQCKELFYLGAWIHAQFHITNLSSKGNLKKWKNRALKRKTTSYCIKWEVLTGHALRND